MLFQRSVSPRLVTAPVTGHPPSLVETLHGVGGEPHIKLLFIQLIRNAVVVLVRLDVEVLSRSV
jgi:hypothetical protein